MPKIDREALSTAALAEAADTCDLCGRCDLQCHFVTGMQPTSVMRALKDLVEAHRRASGEVLAPAEDEGLRKMREIVGRDGASNDPAVLWTYADDPFPPAGPRPPRYVDLPGPREEVAALARLAEWLGLDGTEAASIEIVEGDILDPAWARAAPGGAA